MLIKEDKNFDNLIHRFEKVVYASSKGDWRLKLLKEDLQHIYSNHLPLTIWDAGCGFGQISLWLAANGHHLTLCDVSKNMLAHAEQQFAKAGLAAQFHVRSAQELAPELPDVDIVLCHAVLEWLAEPYPTLAIIADKVKVGGYLSLMFYNRNAMIYKNILKGGWRLPQILNDTYLGKGSKLTPPNPQFPKDVLKALEHMGFAVEIQTGIRVFHDYLSDEAKTITDHHELFELEYRYCRMPVFRDMGRYVHVLAQRR